MSNVYLSASLHPPNGLPRVGGGRLALLALAAALSTGSVYLGQALQEHVAADCGDAVLVPAAGIAGYAFGVLSLGRTRGDPATRRGIAAHGALLALALAMLASAQSAGTATAAAFLSGVGGSAVQRLIATAARESAPNRLATGLSVILCAGLAGIVCVRMAAPAAAAEFGWRPVVLGASVAVCVVFASVAASRIPAAAVPPRRGPDHACPPALRAFLPFALAQAAIFAAYQASWTALPGALPDAGARAAATAVAGALGIAAALAAGPVADRIGPKRTALSGAAAVVAGCCAFVLAGGTGFAGVVIALACIDAGTQVCLVASHARVQAAAPGRVAPAAVLTFVGFLGGAAGAAGAAAADDPAAALTVGGSLVLAMFLLPAVLLREVAGRPVTQS